MDHRHVQDFSRIFQSTKDRLHHFVWKMTRNEADTEDIIQNCYLRLWQKMDTIDTTDDAMPLLFTYARNLVTDHWRKTAGRQAPFTEAPESAVTPVEDHIDYKDCLQQLDAGISQLPAKRRRIFKLVKEDGFSHQHVANHLGISPATVEKQIVLSLRFLRKELGR